jgi:tetratricopeptide (TPR) repeat protein
MPAKRRPSDKTQADSSSAKKNTGGKPSKKATKQSRSRPDKGTEDFSINLDSVELEEWLTEAEGLLWGSGSVADPATEIDQARRTLKKTPDDVDAYLTLAEHSDGDRAALLLFEGAVAAGERVIGRSKFEKLVGAFWLEPKTRPYMQARLSLARCLWALSRRDEAVSHFEELLRLNPSDNQAVRYLLLNSLISLGRFEEAKALIGKYDELSATWAYSQVLVAFHDAGDATPSHTALKAAKRINKHVVPFLLGDKEPPDDQPDFYSPGDKYEASFYLEEAQATWKQVPGALTWLRTTSSVGSRSKKAREQSAPVKVKAPVAPRATGPTPRAKQRLRKLPLAFGTLWQVAVEQIDLPSEDGTTTFSSWMVLAVDLQTGQLIVQDVLEMQPTAGLLWDRLTEAMENPTDGSPCRPAEIQVRTDAKWQEIEPHLQEIEVDVINHSQLVDLDRLVSQLKQHFGNLTSLRGLSDDDQLPPDEIGRLHAAAAEYYRRQPWHFVPMDAPLRVEGTAVGDQPRYCLVMGQSAMTFGLSVYHSLEQIKSMFDGGCCGGGDDGECGDEECGELECGTCDVGGCSKSSLNLKPLMSTLAVVYDTPEGMSPTDLAAIKLHGWPIAGPEAYPAVYRTTAELTPEPPTVADLRLLAACLIAIPGFATRHPFDRGGSPREDFSFSHNDRPVTLTLSWAWEDDAAKV